MSKLCKAENGVGRKKVLFKRMMAIDIDTSTYRGEKRDDLLTCAARRGMFGNGMIRSVPVSVFSIEDATAAASHRKRDGAKRHMACDA